MAHFGFVLVLLLATSAHAQTREAALTPGWDDRSIPLSSGRVVWSATPEGSRLTVKIVFELKGSIANHRFTAGAHFFDPDRRTPDVTQFGGKNMGGRAPLSREGVAATLAGGRDFGVLATDSRGNARAEFTYSVPNQPYAAQFTIRRGADCPAKVADCACVLRTGGRFAQGLERFGSEGAATTPPATTPPATTGVAEPGKSSALTQGWDDRSVPLSSGRVVWSASPASGGQLNLRVVFEVKGSAPNQQLGAGIHFFEPAGSQSPEITQFGGRRMGGRGLLTREGKQAIVSAWDFGVLRTDASGNGRAEFSYTVPNRLYTAQFTVRRGANCSARTADCACIFRTGGQFGANLERFGSGAASVETGQDQSEPPAMETPRSIGPIHWCLACGAAPERRTWIGFTVPSGVRTVVVQLRNGYDDTGDGAVELIVGGPNGRILLTTRGAKNSWEEFRCAVAAAGVYYITLRDMDTLTTGTAPGNGGSLKILLE